MFTGVEVDEAACCRRHDELAEFDCCGLLGELEAPRREGELCSGEEEADVPSDSPPPSPLGEPAFSGKDALVSDRLLLEVRVAVDIDAGFDGDTSLHLILLVPASRRLSGLVVG
jgi:hypothetical protein